MGLMYAEIATAWWRFRCSTCPMKSQQFTFNPLDVAVKLTCHSCSTPMSVTREDGLHIYIASRHVGHPMLRSAFEAEMTLILSNALLTVSRLPKRIVDVLES